MQRNEGYLQYVQGVTLFWGTSFLDKFVHLLKCIFSWERGQKVVERRLKNRDAVDQGSAWVLC